MMHTLTGNDAAALILNVRQQALDVIGQHVDDYISRARLGKAA